MTLCDNFVNTPPNKYRPLACKPIVVQTRQLKSHGYANKVELFLIGKSNTIREFATLDLLYPTPLWLKNDVQDQTFLYPRVTDDGFQRVTDDGLIRVASF